ncbi:hypothetical protein A2U01_0118687, partial [Trifolium medium]|nr:hypothetical protein [Trifolium medium]
MMMVPCCLGLSSSGMVETETPRFCLSNALRFVPVPKHSSD